jgi:hypothetical protein
MPGKGIKSIKGSAYEWLEIGEHVTADDTTRKQVNDNGQIYPALMGSNTGNIRHPNLIRRW